jgi:hypothetical protein
MYRGDWSHSENGTLDLSLRPKPDPTSHHKTGQRTCPLVPKRGSVPYAWDTASQSVIHSVHFCFCEAAAG